MAAKKNTKQPKAAGRSDDKRYSNKKHHQLDRVAHKQALHAAVAQVDRPVVAKWEGAYTEELGMYIANLFAQGATFEDIDKEPTLPRSWKLSEWIMQEAHPFRKLYYAAKASLVPRYEELAHRAATQPLIGVRKKIKQVLNKEGDIVTVEEEEHYDNVERAKLQVSTFQWTLSHLEPKKHGRNIIPEGDDEALNDLVSQFRERNALLKAAKDVKGNS